MTPRPIVLYANVLMRAVLGRRVSQLLEDFAPQVTFLALTDAFAEQGRPDQVRQVFVGFQRHLYRQHNGAPT